MDSFTYTQTTAKARELGYTIGYVFLKDGNISTHLVLYKLLLPDVGDALWLNNLVSLKLIAHCTTLLDHPGLRLAACLTSASSRLPQSSHLDNQVGPG